MQGPDEAFEVSFSLGDLPLGLRLMTLRDGRQSGKSTWLNATVKKTVQRFSCHLKQWVHFICECVY